MDILLLVTAIFLSGFALGFYSKNLNGKNRKGFEKENCVHGRSLKGWPYYGKDGLR